MPRKKTKASPKSKRSVKKATNKKWGGDGLFHAAREHHVGEVRFANQSLGSADKLAKKKPGSVAKRVGEYPRKTGLERAASQLKQTKFKAAKARPSAFKQAAKGAARGLTRAGGKVLGNLGSMSVSWSSELGGALVKSHRKYGKRTALQKSRASTRKAAKAGKPRYGSWGAALKADRRSKSLDPSRFRKMTRVKVGGDWWNF